MVKEINIPPDQLGIVLEYIERKCSFSTTKLIGIFIALDSIEKNMTTSKSKAAPKHTKGGKIKGDTKQVKNFFVIVGIIAFILFFLIYMIFQST